MTDEPKLLAEPREGVPNVIDTLPAFRDYCSELASSHGSLAADAERASGFRYGHEDWLVQFRDSPNSAWNRNGCSTRKSPRVCWD